MPSRKRLIVPPIINGSWLKWLAHKEILSCNWNDRKRYICTQYFSTALAARARKIYYTTVLDEGTKLISLISHLQKTVSLATVNRSLGLHYATDVVTYLKKMGITQKIGNGTIFSWDRSVPFRYPSEVDLIEMSLWGTVSISSPQISKSLTFGGTLPDQYFIEGLRSLISALD